MKVRSSGGYHCLMQVHNSRDVHGLGFALASTIYNTRRGTLDHPLPGCSIINYLNDPLPLPVEEGYAAWDAPRLRGEVHQQIV